jgi:hypothetical protein
MAREHHSKPTECFAFEWRRRVKGPGFRWKRDTRIGYLLVGPPDEALQRYEPLVEETGLFLTFAGLSGTEDSFLKFANTYGRLGTYHSYHPEGGEPLEEWQEHHCWMQFLAGLHRELFKERPQLGKWVLREGEEAVFRFPAITRWGTGDWRYRGEFRQGPQSEEGMPPFRTAELRGPAHWFLGFAIEEWLRRLETWHKPIAARMVWSQKEERPQLVFTPRSLLGAMVFQFAAAVHGGWPFRECACCQKYFRLAPGVNRANRRTCSPTCRQYLHNHRVQQARDLSAKGRSAREIVKELKVEPHHDKSSLQLVKSWIGSK